MVLLSFASLQNGQCKFDQKNVGANATGFVDVKSGDEDALKTAVATGDQGFVKIFIQCVNKKKYSWLLGLFVLERLLRLGEIKNIYSFLWHTTVQNILPK